MKGSKAVEYKAKLIYIKKRTHKGIRMRCEFWDQIVRGGTQKEVMLLYMKDRNCKR